MAWDAPIPGYTNMYPPRYVHGMPFTWKFAKRTRAKMPSFARIPRQEVAKVCRERQRRDQEKMTILPQFWAKNWRNYTLCEKRWIHYLKIFMKSPNSFLRFSSRGHNSLWEFISVPAPLQTSHNLELENNTGYVAAYNSAKVLWNR